VKRNPVARLVLGPARESLVSSSGGLLLRQAIRLSAVERTLSKALAPWRGRRASHDPAKVLVDVATAVALGGDCLADLARGPGPTGGFRPGGQRSDGVAAGRYARRGHRLLVARDPGRARCGACRGVDGPPTAGRVRGRPRRWPGHRGHRRHIGGRAFGQGTCRTDPQADLRVRAHVRVRRPWRARHRRDADAAAASRQRLPVGQGRPHRGSRSRPRPAARG
jgi:hypothetical protein